MSEKAIEKMTNPEILKEYFDTTHYADDITFFNIIHIGDPDDDVDIYTKGGIIVINIRFYSLRYFYDKNIDIKSVTFSATQVTAEVNVDTLKQIIKEHRFKELKELSEKIKNKND